MSPNLSPAHTPGLKPMFERIAYDLMSLVGLGTWDHEREHGGRYEAVHSASQLVAPSFPATPLAATWRLR